MHYSFHSDMRLEEHFQMNAKKFPKKIAISCNEIDLTYEELDQKSDLVANVIKNNAGQDTQYVGLLMDRGLEMVISLLGILKAGFAYIPIDPSNNPVDRIRLCLSEVNLKLVLTDRIIDVNNVTTILIEKETINEPNQLSVKESFTHQKNEMAYAIFTSGTTGIPKAVPIKHENVVSLFRNSTKIFDFNKDDVWTLFHSFAFDFSVWEIWGALLLGGKLEIVPNNVAKNIARFRRFLVDKKVTVLNQTPSAFYNLIKTDQSKESKIESLKYVILGGEKLDLKLLEPWINKYASSSKLFSGYGTTETTVFTSFKQLNSKDITDNTDLSPLGKAIPGSDMVLIGDEGEIATRGEIYISGEGLSDGYLNRPDLNEKKFISKTISGETVNYYKTGDLAFEKNGELYCIGRADNQVKFNGYRIELEGIESTIMSHPKIMRSIVFVDNTMAYPRLISFLEPEDNLSADEESSILDEVKNIAESLLPFYMVPSEFMIIDKIPLTVNGKVDHKKLLQLS